MDAHLPYHPPEEYAERFAPGVDSTEVCQNSKEFNSGVRDIDDEEWAAIRGLYDAEIRHMDAQLGRLFDHLRETGRWEETTVIVCADHGELHGEHDLYGHEFCIYDQLVNVPLLIKGPGVEPGRDEETTVELVDLYHTVLDATDARAAGRPLDRARSLLSADHRSLDPLSGVDRPRGEIGFVEYHRPVVELRQLEAKAESAGIALSEESRFYSRMGAARAPDAKYVHNTTIPDEAYRLDEDPGERENVAGTGEARTTEMRAALDAFVDEVGATWPDADGEAGDVLDDMGEDAKDRLQDLGYLE